MNYIICAYNIDEEIEKNLIKLGVTPVKLRGPEISGNPFHPLSYHPDMFCFKLSLKENKWIFYRDVYEINKHIIDKLSVEIILEEPPKRFEYPCYVGLNAAFVGNNLICNVKYANGKILKYANLTGINIIDVKQGYSKCSVCTVDENSIVTSDVSVYNRAGQNKINALLIEKGHIDLNGYNYGFIGGCSGLIDKNRLVFTGNIKRHPNYEDIKKFCGGRGVEIISLSEKKLYDYGSLLML